MLIQSMTPQASIELLVRAKVGRLACAHEGQPYITPMSFMYDAGWLYSFSTMGQKIAWMRANPLVCVEADEVVNPQNWATVVVLGRYEEIPGSDTHGSLRAYAHDLLQKRPMWWEPGYVKTVIDGKERPLELVYFRVRMDKISGHRGVPDTDQRPGR